MELFEKLIQIRKEKKITQTTMSNFLNINQLTLSRYEQGKRDIPLKTLIKYADYLGYELRILLKL